MTGPVHRGVALLTASALTLSACATSPGPVETGYAQVNAICAAGDRHACRQAAFLYPQVLAEREQQQSQNSTVAASVGLGIIVLALGAAIAGGGSQRHYGGYGRGRGWHGHRGW